MPSPRSSTLLRKLYLGSEDQIRVCRQAALRFGVVVLESQLHYDEERTGATSHRPGYQALLAAAKARQFDAILVESQDGVRMLAADRAARSASSSWTTGTPNIAITASPMNFSTMPPYR